MINIVNIYIVITVQKGIIYKYQNVHFLQHLCRFQVP